MKVSSFQVNFLTIFEIDREVPEAAVKAGQTVSIEASTVEIEERGVKERSFSFFRFFVRSIPAACT